MNNKEYIIPIGEEAQDYDEMFIGVIRRQPELVRCKDCKHRIINENYGKKGHMMNLKAMCDLDSGDPFELGRRAEDNDWFCADGERNV